MRFALLLLSLIAAPVFAQDYYWWSPKYGPSVQFSAPQLICDRARSELSSGTWITNVSLRLTSDSAGYCEGSGSGMTSRMLDVYRQGDQCPSGATYNPTTGVCDAPTEPNGEACEIEGQSPLTGFGFIRNASGQCVDYTRADLPSQCRALANTSGFTDVRVDFDSDGNPQTPPPMDVGGCAGQVVTVEHCEMAPQRCQNGLCMQSSSNRCRVAVSFNGEVAGDSSPLLIKGQDGAEEGICPPGENCDPEPAPVQKEEQPCNYVEDGEGRMVCSATKWTAEPGQQSCGTVNGKFDCYGRAPTSNGIQIDTKVETKPNAAGGTTTTKTDTHTQTICTGANSCTTTTTVTVNRTDKNAAGETTGQSSTCTGPKCAGTGKTDSDGDGLEDEPDEAGFVPPEAGDEVGGFGESAQEFMTRLESAPIVSGVSGISVPGGGSCSFPSAQTAIGTISMDSFCDLASVLDNLRGVFLAVWALAAVRVLMSA